MFHKCHEVCDAHHYLLDNIFIVISSILFRQIVDIPIGTNYSPLPADLFLFCYERDFMFSFLTIIKLMLLKHLTLPQDI